MEFEWHEAKRMVNRAKQGFDFLFVPEVFEQPHIELDARPSGDEVRHLVIGVMRAELVAVVYTMRGAMLRVISIRKARRNERQRYQAVHG